MSKYCWLGHLTSFIMFFFNFVPRECILVHQAFDDPRDELMKSRGMLPLGDLAVSQHVQQQTRGC